VCYSITRQWWTTAVPPPTNISQLHQRNLIIRSYWASQIWNVWNDHKISQSVKKMFVGPTSDWNTRSEKQKEFFNFVWPLAFKNAFTSPACKILEVKMRHKTAQIGNKTRRKHLFLSRNFARWPSWFFAYMPIVYPHGQKYFFLIFPRFKRIITIKKPFLVTLNQTNHAKEFW